MKLILFYFLFITATVYCNEAILEVAGGSVKPLYNSNTNVRLDSEVVVITLDASTYSVDAKFFFSNSGTTEIIAVGFPKYSYGYYQMNNYNGLEFFNYFMTFVNNTPVEFEEMMSEVKLPGFNHQIKLGPGFNVEELKENNLIEDQNWFSETRWLVKNVLFKANEKLTTEVSYEAPYGDYGFHQGAEYLYGTGKTWAENIGNARFIIKFAVGSWPIAFLDRRNFIREDYIINRLNEYSFEILVQDFEPHEEATLSFIVSGEKFTWDWDFEYYSKNRVSDDQLKIMDLAQLRIFRNSFYARHGRTFKSDDLRNFFKKEGWYKPNEAYHDSLLNEIEISNAKKIFDYEQKLNLKFGVRK